MRMESTTLVLIGAAALVIVFAIIKKVLKLIFFAILLGVGAIAYQSLSAPSSSPASGPPSSSRRP